MARFWFLSAPLYSHTDWGGFLKTAKALQAKGHDVVWISESPLSSAIQQAGIPFHAIEHSGWLWPPPPPPDFTTIPPQEAVKLRYTRALDTWLSEDLVAKGVELILALADEIPRPDLIVSDPFLSAAALAAEKLDVPFVVAGWTAQGDLNADELFPVQRDLSSDSQQRVARLCDRFQLQGTNFSRGTAPSVISPHLHISYFVYDWYQSEAHTLLPQNVFVGGTPAKPSDPLPQWLTDIPDEQALGVITLGTTFTGDLGFYSWAAQAVAQAGLVPVVAIGWNPIEPDKKQELVKALPRGTRLLNYVPFDDVLPRAKIMIHHGGMGTTHSAIIHGVPQIIVPHAADQRIQARRVSEIKVGLNLTAHDVQRGQLKQGVQAILEAAWVQENAQQLAQQMAVGGGPTRAAALIEDLLG